MKTLRKRMPQLSLLLLCTLMIGLWGGGQALAAGEVSIFVPPGESITYNIEAINNTNRVVTAPLQVSGLAEGWTTKLNGGGWQLKDFSIKGSQQEQQAATSGGSRERSDSGHRTVDRNLRRFALFTNQAAVWAG